ncbi:hypothetical protein SDRG_01539 [Saprolegnia diclina VS20]|uniref:Uncharacterized protein n=1 Tax=Saprolegnia diclina (strain VS20) TaxID=1156394 RepID=T0S8I4_SAPDV|nr:hypothetical protein SDRG_01539 [Saprolegnia diclina VS20]EQC41578.1 hypothetical protein SDRG_01539 [Saprolegnia diclina VS20]|eukprot:XP_008605292.1 hypothetical protein SDRG_01539 [Saprolegnia diclina VS20]
MAKLLTRWQTPKKRSPKQLEEDLLRERLEQLRMEHLNILSPPDEKAKKGRFTLFSKDEPEPMLERRRSTSVTAPAFIKNAFRSSSVGNNPDDSSHLEGHDDEATLDMLHADRRRSASLSSSFLKNPFRSNSIPSSLPSTADEDDDLSTFPIEQSTVDEDPTMERRRGLSTSFLKNPFRLSSPEDTDDNSSTSSHPSTLTSTLKKVSRSFSRAMSKNLDVVIPGGRYVGESVHTAAGAGVVTEVKPDGSAVVRLCNTNIVNCSCVIVEADGEIEPLSALPGDFVFTHLGPGTVLSYDPKLREFQVDIAEETHAIAPSDIIASSEANADDGDFEAAPTEVSGRAKSTTNVALEFALRASKYLKPSTTTTRFKYAVGQTVLTTFGDGTILEIRPCDHTYVVQFAALSIGYVQEDAVKGLLKAKTGDAVSTRFGTGVVASVVDENVFIVRVGHEDMYVHATDLTLAKTKTSPWSLRKKAPAS